MLLTRIEEWVFAGGRASYRRVEITSIIRSCLLRNPGVSAESPDQLLRGGIQLMDREYFYINISANKQQMHFRLQFTGCLSILNKDTHRRLKFREVSSDIEARYSN